MWPRGVPEEADSNGQGKKYRAASPVSHNDSPGTYALTSSEWPSVII